MFFKSMGMHRRPNVATYLQSTEEYGIHSLQCAIALLQLIRTACYSNISRNMHFISVLHFYPFIELPLVNKIIDI